MRSLLAVAVMVTVGLGVQGLTREHLAGFTFDLGDTASVTGGKVPLADGRWTDPDGSRFALHPVHAFGDLDGDGAGDAVAVLVEDTGGTGSFVYLFALLNRDGAPVQAGEAEWLGDRTVVQRVTIDRKGTITVRYITHNDGDPACCPTQKIEDRYRVKGGRLIGITQRVR